MSPVTRQRWSQFYRTFQEPRSYTKTIDIERTLAGYSCAFEVSVKLWENDEHLPSIHCVSAVEAFDRGGKQVLGRFTQKFLNAAAEQYAQNHIEEIVDEIERKSK